MFPYFHKMYIYFSKRREFDSCHAIFSIIFSTAFYGFFDNISELTQNLCLILHKLLIGNQAMVNTEEVPKLTKLSASAAAWRVGCKDAAMMFQSQLSMEYCRAKSHGKER